VNIVLLSGGVGGARLARGLVDLGEVDLTVVVNVGDDDEDYGLAISPDLDTVSYTMAGVQGPQGWGLGDDSFTTMHHLSEFGIDTTFQIGDADLATKLFRTDMARSGMPLSAITRRIVEVLDIAATVLPASDDRIRTRVKTADGHWRSFREYFVTRHHQDEVRDLAFDGATEASPAPGVLEALDRADAVIIGPSNPPLSIWPILAIPGIAGAIATARRRIAVSPLIDGKAVKGPADRVLLSLGMPPGNEGIVAAYGGLVDELVIDQSDASERGRLTATGTTVHIRDTHLGSREDSRAFASWLIDLL